MRASYQAAIDWIAYNDDTEWVKSDPEQGGGASSVTACLVADIFGKDEKQVRKDIIKSMERRDAQRAA